MHQYRIKERNQSTYPWGSLTKSVPYFEFPTFLHVFFIYFLSVVWVSICVPMSIRILSVYVPILVLVSITHKRLLLFTCRTAQKEPDEE